jgi:hypothetical protein
MLVADRQARRMRRIISDPAFKPPAQMIMYANKVALTAYNEEIVTTVIENKDIRTTCMLMFEYIWSASRVAHENLIKSNP